MISVIMPVYNGELFLREAVDSILNQTYRDFEFIIVDDGSTDSTPQILAEYAAKDDRVKIINGGHVGISKAMNLGIEQATRPWIARMDADDVCLPERFEKQLAAAEKDPDVVVWGGYIHHINEKGKILSYSKVGPATREDFWYHRNNGLVVQVMNPTALMKTEIVRKVGGYKEAFVAAHDVEIFDEMAEYGPILAVPEPLVLYRIHGSSITMTKFFTQRKLARYVDVRRNKRLAGETIPTLEEFMAEYDNVSRWEKLGRYREDLKALYYRRAGMAYAQGNYLKTGYFFGISMLIDPHFALQRVWRQIFSHRASKEDKKNAVAVEGQGV